MEDQVNPQQVWPVEPPSIPRQFEVLNLKYTQEVTFVNAEEEEMPLALIKAGMLRLSTRMFNKGLFLVYIEHPEMRKEMIAKLEKLRLEFEAQKSDRQNVIIKFE